MRRASALVVLGISAAMFTSLVSSGGAARLASTSLAAVPGAQSAPGAAAADASAGSTASTRSPASQALVADAGSRYTSFVSAASHTRGQPGGALP